MTSNPASRTMKSDEEWKKLLTPEQFHVARQHGTERPFSSPLNSEKRPGLFKCMCCGTPLFSSSTKFDSGTGWPSFWAPVDKAAVSEKEDGSWLMRRTEVRQADRGALLHERCRAQLRAGRDCGKVIAAQRRSGERPRAGADGHPYVAA